RIARELHDDTIQALVAIAQRIDVALGVDTDSARPLLAEARTQAVDAVTSLRRLIADCRRPALDELGLVPALRMAADKAGDVPVSVEVRGVERRLEPDVELALYRTAHEALANARRHANATQIWLRIAFRADA